MKLVAIHHVAIIVSDYEKARDFYVNKLGFAVVREGSAGGLSSPVSILTAIESLS